MLTAQNAAAIKAMIARGDKQHDIAAYFGENPARIAEVKSGEKFADVKPAKDIPPPPLRKEPRFIDPKASLDKQVEQLNAFMDNPPENGRWVTFSPQLSGWINATINNQNRRKRPSNIRRFADAMKNEEWARTGDTVKFSRDKLLLDGQNRFAAGQLSGKAFVSLAVFGIDPNAFAKIDTNAVRTNADTIEIVGVPHSRIVASAVRWLIIGQDRGKSVTNVELYDYYREHVDAKAMQLAARRAKTAGRILPTGALTYLLYQFNQRHKRLAEQFADDLAKRKRGALKLLKHVSELRKNNMGRVNELQLQAMIILTWNAYRANQQVTASMLRWNAQTQEFPAIA